MRFTYKMSKTHWPEDVGILALDFVLPKLYVAQPDLEKFNDVSEGKYTVGLGQKEMAFCSNLEDINSLCLTAFNTLMEHNALKYEDIGRVDVGTETIIDKSKSVATVLMELFEESGNSFIGGLDTTNACFGGTAALFNAVNWIESSSWDGRLAVVIAGDIASYAKGNAQPTGGVGAVAMLVGPNAPLVLDRGLRVEYKANVYDFYKPDLASEYPVVDGLLSIKCYLSALDNCYSRYKKAAKDPTFSFDKLDAFLFHSPFCKLVQKAVARLVLNDFIGCDDKSSRFPALSQLTGVTLENSYFDKKIETEFMEFSKPTFDRMTDPSLLLARRVGNMYTASLYSCLLSYLISTPVEKLAGKRIGMFSYGSGLASAMYSITARGGPELQKLVGNVMYLNQKLDERKKVTPTEYSRILKERQDSLHVVPFVPKTSVDYLFPGTWYIRHIDEKHRRSYCRKVE